MKKLIYILAGLALVGATSLFGERGFVGIVDQTINGDVYVQLVNSSGTQVGNSKINPSLDADMQKRMLTIVLTAKSIGEEVVMTWQPGGWKGVRTVK